LGSLISSIFNVILGHVTSIVSSSYELLIEKLKNSAKVFLNVFIVSFIVSGFFCLSTLLAFFEIAYQYDKTQSVKFTAVLFMSLFISVLSLALITYVFKFKEINSNNKAEDSKELPKDNSLEHALSMLILEFAKDKEFARKQEQMKENINSETYKSDLVI
jgi:hypothetical protein